MVTEIQEEIKNRFGEKDSVIIDKNMTAEDQSLLAFIKDLAPKIMVIGAGGSGSNTMTRLTELGINGATVVAANTDAQHLLLTKANRKILLGKKRTRGLGAGSNPVVGEQAAEESFEEIKNAVAGMDLVFITCGMGGGTGTGAAHVIAKAAKAQGAIVVAVTTLPFTSEGPKRAANAAEGLTKLKKEADTTIAIRNDKLLEYVGDLPLNQAFKACDMVLANSVKGIIELITKPGLVNLDFADIRTVLEKSGSAVIGVGEVDDNQQKDRLEIAAEKALNSPLLDVDLSKANKALVNITGGSGMTLGEAERAVTKISQRISKDAHIIWGATIDESLGNKTVRVLAVLAGVGEKEAPGQVVNDEALDEIGEV